MYIYVKSKKNGIDEPIFRGRNGMLDGEWACGRSGEGESWMNGENKLTCIQYKIDS